MADVALTAAQVAPVNETQYIAKTYIANVAVTPGQPLYMRTDGKVDLARANAVGTMKLVGVSMHAAAANKPVAVMIKGSLAGFTLSGLNYGTTLYVSTTAGGGLISDTAITGTGNVNTPIGMVEAMSDAGTLTKVFFVDVPHFNVPVALP